jgi:hypothetical protein
MKPSRTSKVFYLRFWLDTYGILLALVLGVSAQVIALNPFGILAFRTPMLSHRDWAGSRASSGPSLYSSFTTDPLVEKREFTIRLYSEDWVVNGGGEIWQRAVWYADPAEALAAWDRRESSQFGGDFSSLMPDQVRPTGPDTPGSVLYYSEWPEDNFFNCQYMAYWQHWYTEVWFWSRGDQFLSRAQVQALTDHVDQLLLKAPNKPLLLFIP